MNTGMTGLAPRGGRSVSSAQERGGRGATRQPARILVVDDERSMREFLAIMLTREGYEVVAAENGVQALASLRRGRFDLLVSDIRMPDCSGLDVLREAKQAQADLPGILMTGFASTETAIEALRTGAIDYISKPFDVDEMKRVVALALERHRLMQDGPSVPNDVAEELSRGRAAETMIGRSSAMQRVFSLIEAIAPTASTVLITGESGTGKEVAARAVHRLSPRGAKPFVALNCGALTETLLESELFGYVKGAFTGAATTRHGLIEEAEGGTIFLDEIGEMSPLMQVKLLRVLQERRFRRVGGTEEIAADIRVIAATNRDLARMVAEGSFREDLYYRVNVIPVVLPPLRERREDIALLARHFLLRFAEASGRVKTDLAPETVDRLVQYRWPGNIRELENAMERAIALETSSCICPESLPEHILGAAAPLPMDRVDDAVLPPAGLRIPEGGLDLEQHVRDVERAYIAEALHRANGVKMRAAELLGMSFRSFRYYAKKYEL